MAPARVWIKMLAAGAAICVGGPALVVYLSPTEEELFKKYNPDLQKRSLQNREERQKEFDDFVTKLKEYSKSDKPIWAAEAEAKAMEQANARLRMLSDQRQQAEQAAQRKQELLDSTKK